MMLNLDFINLKFLNLLSFDCVYEVSFHEELISKTTFPIALSVLIFLVYFIHLNG